MRGLRWATNERMLHKCEWWCYASVELALVNEASKIAWLTSHTPWTQSKRWANLLNSNMTAKEHLRNTISNTVGHGTLAGTSNIRWSTWWRMVNPEQHISDREWTQVLHVHCLRASLSTKAVYIGAARQLRDYAHLNKPQWFKVRILSCPIKTTFVQAWCNGNLC